MNNIVIAIDGYAGSGKSTTAKAVAKALRYTYINSGAMYRAVTLYFQAHSIALTNATALQKALEGIHIEFFHSSHGKDKLYLNGIDVERKIQASSILNKASQVSALPIVRKKMVKLQQSFGKNKDIVMDGRDIGTTVFPKAALKIFMTAHIDVRAQRRQQELKRQGQLINFEEVKANLIQRDHMDQTRTVSPLQQAKDAIEIDTTHMLLDEQVAKIVHLAHKASC